MTVLKKIVLCLFGFFISLFLFACTNFLNGNELSKALEKEIESNTKNPITIRLSIENPNIQYLTNYGDFSIKLYEEKTIEFKIDSSLYEFENWKVLSKNNSSTDCSNNVSLQTENSGNTFKTKLIVNSVDSDLILIPITKTLPNVNIIEPKNSVSGVICFRPIKITFSTPMNESDLNTFENITITDRYGVMLSDDDDDYSYFNKPELSEDGLTLTIKPKAKISEIVTASRTNRIQIILSPDIREKECDTSKFNGYTYSYTINKEEDVSAPLITSFSLSKKILNFETDELILSNITEDEFSNWDDASDEEYINHVVRDSVILNSVAVDDNSGVKCFTIKETLIRNQAGETVNRVEYEQEFGSFSENELNEYQINDYEYKIRSRDGFIKLEIGITDYCYNKTLFTYYVQKYSNNFNLENSFNLNVKPEEDKKLSGCNSIREAVNGVDTIQGEFELLNLNQFKTDVEIPAKISISYSDEGSSKKNIITEDKIINSTTDSFDFIIVRNEDKKTTIDVEIKTLFGEKINRKYYIFPTVRDANIQALEWDIVPTGGSDVQSGVRFRPDFRSNPGFISVYVTHKGERKPVIYNDNYYTYTENNFCYCLYSNNDFNSYYSMWCYKEDYFPDLKDGESVTFEVYFVLKNEESFITSCVSKVLNLKATLIINKSGEETYTLSSCEEISKDPIVFPEFDVDYKPIGETGTYQFTVNCTKEGSPKYKWDVFYTVGEKANRNAWKNYPKSNSWVIDTGRTYYVGYVCKDNNGFVIATSQQQECKCESNYPLITLYQNDSGLGGYGLNRLTVGFWYKQAKDYQNNDLYINYWIIPNEGFTERDDYDESVIEAKKLKKYTKKLIKGTDIVSQTGHSQKVVVPVNNSINDYVTVFVEFLEINANNETVKSTPVYKFSASLKLQKDYVVNPDGITITGTNGSYKNIISSNIGTTYNGSIYYFDTTNIKWSILSNRSSTPDAYENLNGSYIDNFIKYEFSDNLNTCNSTPVYIYPRYKLNPSNYPSDILSDIIAGNKGYEIKTNIPALIEVVYNSENLISVDEWETRGITATGQVISSSTYYVPNTTNVESGNWYVTMVHFANGEKMVTEAKFKN